ncbi:thiamine pyrophosphate-dependent enzyme [Leucobacter albus]|uniref:Thiamine pyrophosphate-dependent enzyme n=1 Tax=Leucobacter albus TaxID=272210 RepID=A0ABW3TRX5_9MICO
MTSQTPRSGGELLVDTLAEQGVTRVSCVPGESYLPVLDALREAPIEVDVCRHEAGAGNMAVAVGKLTGRAGVAMVTRGPGAMHAAIAVHTAEQDAVPMLLLIGQVALRDRERGGFQEMNYHEVFGSVAKWVVSLDTVERIPETMARAFRIAEGGRPGPVVIEMPEDVLAEVASVPDVPRIEQLSAAPTPAAVAAIRDRLAAAERPLVLLGRSTWSQETADAARAFAEQYELPTLAAFRCQDYIDNTAAVYCGHVGLGTDATLAARLEQADVILAVGGHIGDAETKGYEILGPRPGRTLLHVAASEMDVDRYLQASVAVQATPIEFFRAMLGAGSAPEGDPAVPAAGAAAGDTAASDPAARRAWLTALRAEEVARATPPQQADDVLSAIMTELADELPADTIVANGAGNYAVWVHQFVKYRRYGTQLAPASGAMGFGLPAGIAGGLVHPERPVVVFAGDGCFSMAMTEMGVLKSSGVPAIVVIVNNGIYGTIRLHQERRYPGRVSATSFENPDFVLLAQAFGFTAERVTDAEEFMRVYREASARGEAAVIEVMVDPQRSTPSVRLDELQG